MDKPANKMSSTTGYEETFLLGYDKVGLQNVQ